MAGSVSGWTTMVVTPPAAADRLHALGALRRLSVDDLDDAAVSDQDRAGAVIVAGGVQQAGVDDGERLRLGGHAAPPARRWARAASTAMRAATPIST